MANYDLVQRKALSALCHGACFFSASFLAVGVPIVILMLTDDPVVKANAKESINFQISFFIWMIISILLALILIGFVMLVILMVFSYIAPIFATVSVLSNPNRRYRYDGIFHIL